MFVFRPQATVLRVDGKWRQKIERASDHISPTGVLTPGEPGEVLNQTLIDGADHVPSDLRFGSQTGRDGKERFILLRGYRYHLPAAVATELADHWPQWLREEADPPPDRVDRQHQIIKSPETVERELRAEIENLKAMVAALTAKPGRKAS